MTRRDRIVFAGVTVGIAAQIGGLIVFEVMALRMLGAIDVGAEACTVPRGGALRWQLAAFTIMMQVLCGLLYALSLVVLARVLRKRFADLAQWSSPRAWFETAAIGAFAAFSVGAVIGVTACDISPFATISAILMTAGALALLAATALFVTLLVRGIRD